MPNDNNYKGLRILVIDDEPDIVEIIRFNLEEEGFIVTSSENGHDAWKKIENNKPDTIVLDFMLPGINGLDLCKKIKSKYDVPVIMVTARTTETDAVLCLEMGADDYIRKPFSPRELVARVRAVLRRQVNINREALNGSLKTGEIDLNMDAHKVLVNNKQINLTMIEYDLLSLFMKHPGIAFSRDKLLDRIWGREVYVTDRIIDVNIKRLREKLGNEKKRLETVRGIGYRFSNE